MSASKATLSRLFPWNPAGFNPVAGVILFVFALVLGAITIFTDLNLVVVIIGALLAWMTSVPGTLANRTVGMAIYGGLGALGILVANAINGQLAFALTMFAVGVACTLPMALSSRAYLVGWSIIITFIQAVNMTGSEESWESAVKLLCGAGVVALFTVLWPNGTGPWGKSGDNPPPESGGNDDQAFVGVYALTVGVVLGLGAYLGIEWFAFGVQMIAMSSFMVLGPTTKQDWVSAVGRSIGVVVGITLSFILVNAIDSLDTLTIIWAIFPGIAIAMIGVSLAFTLSAYTTQMMMTIVLLGGDYDGFALDSNNRIVGEILGITLAVAASFFLQWWATTREVRTFAQPETASPAELAAN
ncbi:MAG: hypothetical protein ACR2PK_08430 [Acidimicrobiales bacterium]